MTKKFFTLLAATLTAASTFAQFTVDGNLNEAGYTTTIPKTAPTSCFGPDAANLTSIKIGNDGSAVYVGIVGKLPIQGSNGAGLWINFTGLSGGTPAGSSLKTTGAGHYMKAQGGETPPFQFDFKPSFEVDYMFAFNTGGTTDKCYVDAVKRVGSPVAGYLDEIGQAGIALGGLQGTGVFNAPGIEMAYSYNATVSTYGIEVRIPYAAVGLTAATAGSVQAFAFEVSPTAYFSNQTIPGNFGTGCLGTDGAGGYTNGGTVNFSTLSGGPYHNVGHVIPVELMSFDANRQSDKVALTWKTANEKDNSHFDIERSADGRTWATIGTQKGAGASNTLRKYQFLDDAPLQGVNYYRLRQVDFNGAESFSAVVAVNSQVKNKAVAAYPNPAKDVLTLANTEGGNLTAQVYDMMGRLVIATPLNGTTLDIANLPVGLFQLQLSDKNGTTVGRVSFVKN
jgi:hypothetical protein